MHTSFVLIDFENVQPADLATLAQPHFKVMVFAGAQQASIPFDLAQALQRMGERGQYIKVSGNGRNALDFHIAFYIGQLAAAEPAAAFHIVSKDKGFDPLVQHLRARNIVATRATDLAHIGGNAAKSKSLDEDRIATVVARLRGLNGGRPRKVKTLSNAISAMFQKQLTAGEIHSIVQTLQRDGTITVKDDKVAYALP